MGGYRSDYPEVEKRLNEIAEALYDARRLFHSACLACGIDEQPVLVLYIGGQDFTYIGQFLHFSEEDGERVVRFENAKVYTVREATHLHVHIANMPDTLKCSGLMN